MKVTYTQNRFEIDGVEIINPEVLGNVCIDSLTDLWVISLPDFTHRDLQNGDSFDLLENIIAEMWHNDKTGKPIYRLKLKEPLVDTGSKINGDVAAYNHAIDDVIKELQISVEFGYIDRRWEYILNDIEKLRKP